MEITVKDMVKSLESEGFRKIRSKGLHCKTDQRKGRWLFKPTNGSKAARRT